MEKFISCDWGTSSFRMRMVDSADLSVVEQISNDRGIAGFYQEWKNSGNPEQERLQYYLNHLDRYVSQLLNSAGEHRSVPVIISGMASSSIGMRELEYAELPLGLDGSGLKIAQPRKDMILISGARVANDVLRGEETMLIGCKLEQSSYLQLLIFPGTHSKHVEVQNGIATTFRTYMTGEFFHLLSKKSILSNSVADMDRLVFDNPMFDEGVRLGMKGNLLHEAFMVRTNQLLKNTSSHDNYFFLSGLVIGSELKDLNTEVIQNVVIVASDTIAEPYLRALRIIAPKAGAEVQNADKALLNGQRLIYHRYK